MNDPLSLSELHTLVAQLQEQLSLANAGMRWLGERNAELRRQIARLEQQKILDQEREDRINAGFIMRNI